MARNNFPRDWAYDASCKDAYTQLREQAQSPFHGREQADIFVFSMALGFHRKHKVPLKKRLNYILFSAIKEYEWVISSVAVADAGFQVLLDKQRIARIAEEYAFGGMETLKKIVFGEVPGKVQKRILTELKELVSE